MTARKEPRDVDMVLWTSEEFETRVKRKDPDAVWLVKRASERRPRALDLFVATNEEDWLSWMRLFEHDAWAGKKGLVEVAL